MFRPPSSSLSWGTALLAGRPSGTALLRNSSALEVTSGTLWFQNSDVWALRPRSSGCHF